MRGCGKPFDISISCSYSRALSADHGFSKQPSDARINSNAAETPETAAVDDILSIPGLSFCHPFDFPHELLAV